MRLPSLEDARARALLSALTLVGALVWAPVRVAAQGAADTGAEEGGTAPGGNGVTVESEGKTINVRGSFGGGETTTSSSVTTYGLPPPGTNLEAHLPSSSQARSDVNQGDSFDLLEQSKGPVTLRGRSDALGVGVGKDAPGLPELHLVKKGDTLWDLCAAYFQNPWLWPQVWSQNPQLQNPHWIYPGDQLRLRAPGQASVGIGQSQVLGSGSGFTVRRPLVQKDTVFLRNLGYIDDPGDETWGELVGAHEEQLMLAEGNHVYMIMRPGVNLRLGQLLTAFRPSRKIENVPGARMPKGELVTLLGAIKVDRWDPNTRVARGTIVESLDIIERGAKVGAVGRRFDVVPHKPSSVDLEARVLTSMYPHPFVGSQQVVFIDRGSHDGLVAGNRLYVVRRGDTWRQTLTTTTSMARARVRLDDPEVAATEQTPIRGDEENFPEEVVGELQVIRAHKWSALALVVEAEREIEPGDRAVARRNH